MFRLTVALSVLCLASASLLDSSEEDGLNNTGRIVNGRNAMITEHPYQVSVQKYHQHFCGGSVISNNWILTAAHCLVDIIQNSETHLISVRLGSSRWDSGGSVKTCDFAINHPSYNPSTMDYDVGLLRTIQEIIYSASIKPSKLMSEPCKSGLPVVVSGWGRMHQNAQVIPKDLQSVALKAMSPKDCVGPQSAYREYQITENMVCSIGDNKDSCQGDSGGPLNFPNSLCQVGIVSWGEGCAQPGRPGVYAALSDKNTQRFIKHYVPTADFRPSCY